MQLYFSHSIPEGKWGVLEAEIRTGIVLAPNGKRLLGEDIQYLVFSSLADAEEYAKKKISDNPEIECAIFNHINERVRYLKDEAYIASLLQEDREARAKRKKPWWKLW